MSSGRNPYFIVQDNVHAFCKTPALDDSKARAKHENIAQEIQTLDTSKEEKERFQQMIDLHLQRLLHQQTFEEFMKQSHTFPQLRIGLLVHTLQKADYAFIEKVAQISQLSVQACADIIFDNEYQDYIRQGAIQKMWISFKELSFDQAIFDDFSLQQLQYLCISQVSGSSLDLSSLGSLYLDKLIIQSSNNLQKLKLGGKPSELSVIFLDAIEIVDITAMGLNALYETEFRWNNKEAILKCSEAQYQCSERLRKIRVKKEEIASTYEEIDDLVNLYNWDEGVKFLKWVIKQANCDKGTALNIYWLGKPAFDTQYQTTKEVPSWRQAEYKLLKSIERNIKKGFYKNASISFDVETFKKDLQYPDQVVKPIPEFMFENID